MAAGTKQSQHSAALLAAIFAPVMMYLFACTGTFISLILLLLVFLYSLVIMQVWSNHKNTLRIQFSRTAKTYVVLMTVFIFSWVWFYFISHLFLHDIHSINTYQGQWYSGSVLGALIFIPTFLFCISALFEKHSQQNQRIGRKMQTNLNSIEEKIGRRSEFLLAGLLVYFFCFHAYLIVCHIDEKGTLKFLLVLGAVIGVISTINCVIAAFKLSVIWRKIFYCLMVMFCIFLTSVFLLELGMVDFSFTF